MAATELRPFTEADVVLAAAFANKTGIHCREPVRFHEMEYENDSIIVGPFSITRCLVEEHVRTLLGKRTSTVEEYLVEAEHITYSHHSGYDCDVVEVGRADSLIHALRLCAHADLDWKLDNLELP